MPERRSADSVIEPLTLDVNSWSPQLSDEMLQKCVSALESGAVVLCPRLAFEFEPGEERFLSPAWSNGKAKNLSFDNSRATLCGASGAPEDLKALEAMIGRFAHAAAQLLHALLPEYRARLQTARTSFRPVKLEGRRTSPGRILAGHQGVITPHPVPRTEDDSRASGNYPHPRH